MRRVKSGERCGTSNDCRGALICSETSRTCVSRSVDYARTGNSCSDGTVCLEGPCVTKGSSSVGTCEASPADGESCDASGYIRKSGDADALTQAVARFIWRKPEVARVG